MDGIVYQAARAPSDKPSRRYGAAMIANTVRLCSQYLLELTVRRKLDTAGVDDYLHRFAKGLFKYSHTSLWVKGTDNFDSKNSYVFMSNHSSVMDIPTAFIAIPNSLRMITKEELFNIPIFGNALKHSGFIPIDRKNKIKAIRQLEEAKARLRTGISVWVAPEGTRSRTGELGSFKKGGFHVAMALGVPIVPFYIQDASLVVPANSLVVQPNQTIRVYFGKAIDTRSYREDQVSDLMDLVHARMIELRDRSAI